MVFSNKELQQNCVYSLNLWVWMVYELRRRRIYNVTTKRNLTLCSYTWDIMCEKNVMLYLDFNWKLIDSKRWINVWKWNKKDTRKQRFSQLHYLTWWSTWFYYVMITCGILIRIITQNREIAKFHYDNDDFN